MTCAAFMVHVDIERYPENRVQLAIGLAEQYGAALIGVAGWAPRPTFVAEGVVIDSAPTATMIEEMIGLLAQTGQKFRAAAKGIRAVEWRGKLDYPTEVVLREARAADVIIIGLMQAGADPFRALDPGSMVLRAGRPVLAVPDSIDSLKARRVLIAWKDTRECRRAVRDALPFLREAEEVMIVEICEHGTEEEADKRLDDVVNYLLRHRVIVGAKAFLHTKGTVAAKLLAFAADEKVDLLVSGGYGHSRLGEWIFGGVTRELLETSPICCLLSH